MYPDLRDSVRYKLLPGTSAATTPVPHGSSRHLPNRTRISAALAQLYALSYVALESVIRSFYILAPATA